MKGLLLATVFLQLVCCGTLWAEDWPQFRGLNRDAVWNDTGILEKFSAEGLKYRWRVPVEDGYSSPVIANGRVYVTDSKMAKPVTDERILCFDEVTGKSIWTYVYHVDYPDWVTAVQKMGPVSTPIVEDGKLYTLGIRGELICLDAVTGKVIWRINLETELQVKDFVFNPSPVIEGDLLILSVGSFPLPKRSTVIALDKKSGKLVWKTPDDGVSNSSPIVISSGGKRQLILWTQESVISLDPAKGTLYWKEPHKIGATYGCATPVLQGDRLLVGGLMLKLEADRPAASVLWPLEDGPRRRVLSNTSTALFQGDCVYSAGTNGKLICLDAKTGTQLWENETVTNQTNGSSIHLIPNGNRTFLFTDQGELIIAQLGRDGYVERSRTRLVEPTSPYGGKKRAWVPPAFANRHVFARTDRELVCASLAAQP